MRSGVLRHLRETESPQTAIALAEAVNRHQLEIEHHLDHLAEEKLVQYGPHNVNFGTLIDEFPYNAGELLENCPCTTFELFCWHFFGPFLGNPATSFNSGEKGLAQQLVTQWRRSSLIKENSH